MSKQPPKRYTKHIELPVYQRGFAAAQTVFQMSRAFPKEETYSLTDQIRKSPRSVCSNFAEAWRKRRYEAAFISKLSDSEAEAAETQVWLQFAVDCGYVDRKPAATLYTEYDEIIAQIVNMIHNAHLWIIPKRKKGK